MHAVTRSTRVHQMPLLPPWVAEAAANLVVPDSLVLLTCTFAGEESVVLARVSVVTEAGRAEIQPLAVILDQGLANMVEIDEVDDVMFNLVQVARTVLPDRGGDALSTTE